MDTPSVAQQARPDSYAPVLHYEEAKTLAEAIEQLTRLADLAFYTAHGVLYLSEHNMVDTDALQLVHETACKVQLSAYRVRQLQWESAGGPPAPTSEEAAAA